MLQSKILNNRVNFQPLVTYFKTKCFTGQFGGNSKMHINLNATKGLVSNEMLNVTINTSHTSKYSQIFSLKN